MNSGVRSRELLGTRESDAVRKGRAGTHRKQLLCKLGRDAGDNFGSFRTTHMLYIEIYVD